jgi:hypothetical protein
MSKGIVVSLWEPIEYDRLPENYTIDASLFDEREVCGDWLDGTYKLVCQPIAE